MKNFTIKLINLPRGEGIIWVKKKVVKVFQKPKVIKITKAFGLSRKIFLVRLLSTKRALTYPHNPWVRKKG